MDAVTPRPKKRARSTRVRLTHIEIRRGEKLRLRIALADDALAEVGDELGALIKRIAPGTRTAVVANPGTAEEEIIIGQQHDGNDETYHAILREQLTELFTSLCDASLADALEIAREVRARRAEGGN